MIALAGEWDSETGASPNHFSSSAVKCLPICVVSTYIHLILSHFKPFSYLTRCTNYRHVKLVL